jgi:K+-sensing histidine kinase KdpD
VDAAPGPHPPSAVTVSERLRRRATRLAPSPLLRYAVAVGLPLLALAVTRAAEGTFSATMTILFFAAVALSAWFGGLGPGLLTTALSSLLINYYLLPPRHDWSYGRSELIVLAVFGLVAVLISDG